MKRFILKFSKLFCQINQIDQIYYWVYAVIITVVYLGYTLLVLLYGKIIDALSLGEAYGTTFFWYVLLSVGALAIFKVFSYTNITVQKKVKNTISNKIFNILLKNRQQEQSIFTIHLEAVSKLFLDFIYTIPSRIVALSAGFILTFFYSPVVAIILALSIALFFLSTFLQEKWVIPVQEQVQDANQALYEQMDELIQGIPDLQTLKKEDWAISQLRNVLKRKREKVSLHTVRSLVVDVINEANGWIVPCVIVLVSVYFTLSGRFSWGVCLTMIQLSNFVNDEFIGIYQDFNYMIDFMPNVEAVEKLLSDDKQTDSAVCLKEMPEDDFLQVIGLSVSVDQRPLMVDTSFTLHKGEILAIQGASGTGKSTLLSIIAGIKTPQKGQIVRNSKKRMGVLLQNFYIFNRTIRENLMVAKPDATDEEMVSALKKAGLESFYRSLPDGLDTNLSDHGASISGGQRARLALSEIFLQDADLILLDEPLTSVDASTKETVLQQLVRFLQDKACIIVTHDPQIAECATKVMHIGMQLEM